MSPLFSFELPTHRVDQPNEFVTGAAVADVAREAQAAGFAAVHVTDHPAPDAKWLDHGGHHALDPFVALSFAAAATSTLKLLTNIYVAAYRNPFLGAKSVQSLDILSGGRLILGTAAGYLKPEFAALGIDFETRGALLDQALDVLVQTLTGEDTAYDGPNFSARGVRLRPLPVSRPHPPIWIGGNSKAAVRRAVSKYQGWAPFATVGYAKSSRTAEISDVNDLEAAIGWARQYASEIGRTAPLDICFSAGTLLDQNKSLDERHATLRRLVDAGVTWLTVVGSGDDRAALIEGIRSFSKEFIQG
ncbi:LLM class F420-dependent oxidoreductase [Mycobacterium sp. RTGN5]|uniref:LLM class F420-dependent oxidoreductase n=1 Tax=Mycobacterium sp. RTGN5 TaxID=3016522 RepID=UPI0029C8C688|nr:LLM class F420-dependent oxidoreductase [Mycobacterium sp. RTGN5]